MAGHPHLSTSVDLSLSVTSVVRPLRLEKPSLEPLPLPQGFPGLSCPPSQAVEATCHKSSAVLSNTVPLLEPPSPVFYLEGHQGPLGSQIPKHCLLLPYLLYLSAAFPRGLSLTSTQLLRHLSLPAVLLPLSTSGLLLTQALQSDSPQSLSPAPSLLTLNVFQEEFIQTPVASLAPVPKSVPQPRPVSWVLGGHIQLPTGHHHVDITTVTSNHFTSNLV